MLEDLLLFTVPIEYLMKAPLFEAIIIGEGHPVGFSPNALFFPRFFGHERANPHPNLDHLLVHLFIITSDSAVRDCFVGCVPGGEFIKDLFLIG